MTFKPQPVTRAREQVEKQIREAILSGTFGRGERLPSESQLAENFAVSRTTVREALRSLAAAGLIRKVPGATGGSFVQVIDHRSLSDMLGESVGNTLRLGTLKYEEISQVRRMLEVPSAALAAENRTEEDIERLRSIVNRQKEITFDHPEVPPLDIGFHSAIAQASGNRVLAAFVAALHTAIRPVLAKHLDAEAGRHTMRQHVAIVKAIAKGDANAAAEAMKKHLDYLQSLRDANDAEQQTYNGSRERDPST